MRIKTMSAFAAAATLGALQITPASAATIVNGSFESGPAVGGYTTLWGGDTSITGWTVGGSVDYIGSYWQASDGSRSLDLAGSSLGSISQTFATNAGQAYRIFFDVSRNPDAGVVPRAGFINVGLGDVEILYGNPGTTRSNMLWESRFYDFVADGPSTTLTFSADEGTSASYFGLALDNVSIAGVPEPATWAMMILGFGLIGGAMRRRTRQSLTYDFA